MLKDLIACILILTAAGIAIFMVFMFIVRDFIGLFITAKNINISSEPKPNNNCNIQIHDFSADEKALMTLVYKEVQELIHNFNINSSNKYRYSVDQRAPVLETNRIKISIYMKVAGTLHVNSLFGDIVLEYFQRTNSVLFYYKNVHFQKLESYYEPQNYMKLVEEVEKDLHNIELPVLKSSGYDEEGFESA